MRCVGAAVSCPSYHGEYILYADIAAAVYMPPSHRPPPAETLLRSRRLPAGCVIVHKPPGVPFHGTASQPGLLQLMRSQQGQDSFPYEGPLFPVHRLDYLTSGCLILATSSEAAGELVAAFRARAVHKFYVALSNRRPSKKMGSVVGDMQKGRR